MKHYKELIIVVSGLCIIIMMVSFVKQHGPIDGVVAAIEEQKKEARVIKPRKMKKRIYEKEEKLSEVEEKLAGLGFSLNKTHKIRTN